MQRRPRLSVFQEELDTFPFMLFSTQPGQEIFASFSTLLLDTVEVLWMTSSYRGWTSKNSLVGVLTCFQQEAVALLAVVGTMSHQVNEVPEDCNPLQFLWWPNGDLKELMMTVHLFGGVSFLAVLISHSRKRQKIIDRASIHRLFTL